MSTPVSTSSQDLETIRGWLIVRVAGYLGCQAETVPADRPFLELGLESIHAMTLVGDVGERFACELDPAACWVYPTIDDLAQLIAEETC
jgi:acyl carrier protein